MDKNAHAPTATDEGNRNGKLPFNKVIVIGGSAGAIASLRAVLRSLPADFPAPLLAVIHLSPQASHLGEILQRSTRLKVITPASPEPISPGCLYLPQPNRHLLLRDGCVGTAMGPRERWHRPSVDALFRSAARVYHSDVIAVVLSGALDDGSAGAFAIKARRGTIIVEEPASAQVPTMPASVQAHVATDHSVPASKIGALLQELTSHADRDPAGHRGALSGCDSTFEFLGKETDPQGFTCPECGGALAQVRNKVGVQFRCHVGHAFSLSNLSEGHADALERALWVALRRLNEQYAIQRRLAHSAKGVETRRRYDENAQCAKTDMEKLHEILAHL